MTQCTATIRIGKLRGLDRCFKDAGHYTGPSTQAERDARGYDTSGEDWHQGEQTHWADIAEGATPHIPEVVAPDPPAGDLDRLAELTDNWLKVADVMHEQANAHGEKAEALRNADVPPLDPHTRGDDPLTVIEEQATKLDRQAEVLRARALVYATVRGQVRGWLADARWRDLTHEPPPEGEDHRMDTRTLSARLRALADFLDTTTAGVSWLYLDPTPDGPDEPATVHTLEMDGSYAGEVLGNLVALVGSFSRLDVISAEASPGRVAFVAIGGTPQDQDVRGSAIILDPYAGPLQTLLGLHPEGTNGGAVYLRSDLTYTQIQQLAADPQMAATTTQPDVPAVDVPPAPDPEVPSSLPTDQGPVPSPDATTPGPSPSTPEDASSTGASGDPTAPVDASAPSSSPTPSTTVDPQQGSQSSSPPASEPAPSDSSAPQPASPPASSDSPAPATSATDGGSTPAPESGAGGVVVRGSSDAPSPASVTPSPDPVSTAPTSAPTPAPVATGQQPGTPDGAPTNADGTPVEPTAGTTADVGQPETPSPASPGSTGLPGQTPIQVDDTPVDAGAAAGGSSSGAGDPQTQIDALQAEIDRLRAQGEGGTVTTETTSGVQVATNVDEVPDGGQNLATGQGGGATSAAPDQGDGSTTAPAPGPSTAPASDTTNPDGF